MSAEPGPRYRLHHALGEGGMGVVHLGTQTSAAGERLVAIKRLAGRALLDPAARARLVAEARLVFQLTYANICQVLDLGENEAGTFVVLEYVRGDDLAGLLEKVEAGGGRLDVAASVYLAREVARALDYAHRREDAAGRPLGLVHGDVKPPNILLSVEGEVKLADFGIARALGAAAPGTGILGGTPGFMAPEARAGALDHRADIYSLGATLLRALLGRRPSDDVPSVAELDGVPEVPRDLRDIVARALAKERGARWLSAAELERALSAWLARRHPEFTPSVLAELVRRHTRAGDVRGRAQLETPEGATELFDMHTLLDQGTGATAEVEAPPGRERPRTATAAAPSPAWWARAWNRWAALGLIALGAVSWGIISLVAPVPWSRPRLADPVADAAPVAAAGTAPAAAAAADAAPVAAAAADAAPAPASVAAADADAAADAAAVAAAAPAAVAATRPARRASHARTAPSAPSAPAPSPPPAAPAALGYLTVNATPWGSVFVDGRRVAAETPAYKLPLPAGPHTVVVQFGDGGARSSPQSVTIAPGEDRTLGFRQ